MNKPRRAEIGRIIQRLEDLKDKIETARCDANLLKDEEQEYYDGMPESFRSGEKGTAAEAAISQLEEADRACDSAMTELDDAIAALQEAQT